MAMVTIYWKNPTTGTVTTNQVDQNDYQSYWKNQGWSTTPPPSSSSGPSSDSTSFQQATLTSPDGKFKVIVNVGSQEASQLQGAGWKLGDTGQQIITPQQALSSIGTGQAGDGEQQAEDADEETDIIAPSITVPAIATSDPIFVRFTSDPNGPSEGDDKTIWLYFPDKKQYVPFTSMDALLAFTNGVSPEQLQATGLLYILPTSILALPQWGGGAPMNQLFLPPNQGYQANGLLSDGTTGLEQVKENYGKPVNQELHKNSAFAVDGLLTMLKEGGGEISQETVEQILGDTALLKKYAKALAYGGYVLSDVLRDIKRIDLVNGGNTPLANVTLISSTLSKQQFQNNSVYQAAITNPLLTVPTIGGLDMPALDLPINRMPEEIFNTLVPPLPDPTTDEFRGMMEQIEAAFYDVVEMQINAQTETQKRLAEVEWTRFREEIERQYGIKLSNNSIEAWNQIQSITSDYGQRNLAGSGFEAEAIDNYLRGVRRSDQETRITEENAQQKKMREYYQKYASSEEIRDLAQRDHTTAVQWGLVPSQQVIDQFSLSNLRSKYPNTPDYLLQRYAESMVDQYGNYRSDLYQNSYAAKIKNLEGKESYQTSKVLADQAEKEAQAYESYEMSGEEDIISSEYQTPTTVPTTPPAPTTTPVPTPQPTPTPPPISNTGYQTPTTVPTTPPAPTTTPTYGQNLTLPGSKQIISGQDPNYDEYWNTYFK